MKTRIILFFLLLSLLETKAQYSPTYADAGMWNTLSMDYAINKKVSFLLTEELRIKENYSRLNLLYTNIGFEYAANKYIKTSLVYRFIDKYLDENRFGFRHRLMWDATAKYKFNKFTIAYRHRLQVEWRNIQSSETGNIPEWYSRNKVDFSYQINKKWSPYIAIEMRYQISDPRLITAYHQFDRIRFQLGADYKINSFSKCGAYFLHQQLFNVPSNENLYITGLEYSINLKDSPLFKKKKNKKK